MPRNGKGKSRGRRWAMVFKRYVEQGWIRSEARRLANDFFVKLGSLSRLKRLGMNSREAHEAVKMGTALKGIKEIAGKVDKGHPITDLQAMDVVSMYRCFFAIRRSIRKKSNRELMQSYGYRNFIEDYALTRKEGIRHPKSVKEMLDLVKRIIERRFEII